jgi:hypothetical protein
MENIDLLEDFLLKTYESKLLDIIGYSGKHFLLHIKVYRSETGVLIGGRLIQPN